MVLIKSSVKGQKDCKVLICNEEVEFNSDCIAEVSSQEKADEIVKKWAPAIVILDKGGSEPEVEEFEEVMENVDPDGEGSDMTPETPESEEEEEEIDLNDQTVDQLRDLCKSIDLPSKEWKSLTKAKLIAYIESKIK